MSTESVALVPSPPLPPSTIPWTLADEKALIKRENAITQLQLCIARRDQCELDLITFRRKYSESVIKCLNGFRATVCLLISLSGTNKYMETYLYTIVPFSTLHFFCKQAVSTLHECMPYLLGIM